MFTSRIRKYVLIGMGLGLFTAAPSLFAQTTVGATATNTTVQGAAINLNSSYLNANTVGGVTITTPNLQLNGSEKVTGNLTVQGYTVLSGPNTTITGTSTDLNASVTNVGGTLAIKGAVTAASSITATGGIKTTSTLTGTGNVQLNGGSMASNNVTNSTTIGVGSGVGYGVAGATPVVTNAIQIGTGINNTSNSVQISGPLTITGTTNLSNKGIANAGTISGVASGAVTATSTEAVNGSQLAEVKATAVTNAAASATATAQVQTNLNTTNGIVSTHTSDIAQVQRSLTATSSVVSGQTADIANLQSTKADKTALTEVATSAAAASTQVQTNVDAQVSRLDGRVDSTDAVIAANVASAQSYTDVETARATTAEQALRKDLNTQVQRLDSRIDALQQNLNALGAMTAAAVSANNSVPIDAAGQTGLAVGIGHYQGSQAIAFSAIHQISARARVSANVSAANNSSPMVGIGMGWRID